MVATLYDRTPVSSCTAVTRVSASDPHGQEGECSLFINAATAGNPLNLKVCIAFDVHDYCDSTLITPRRGPERSSRNPIGSLLGRLVA